MAHFAKIENGVVTQVIVVDNKDTADASGVEKEYIGAAFCERLLGGTWKQTSYNGNFRKNYAGLGYTFDEARNAFIPPKPSDDATLDEATCQWIVPVSADALGADSTGAA
jgi:murein DD-endopeptidase MepM/ murein hydrolase activator NlpD